MGGSTILSAHGVSKTFSVKDGEIVAVKDLNFEVEEGDFVCLVGASGCGKSTLLNMFAGFTQPTSGEVRLRREPIIGVEPRCGMVFQSYALLPWKTVSKNVQFGLKMQGVARAEREETADRYIRMVNLEGFEDHYPPELSGGMQQRVTFARILAANPEVFLMDEPFAALDAMTRQVMQQELLRIHEDSKKTTLFVTHNIDEALVLSDTIVVMSARPGRVKTVVRNTLPRPRKIDVQLSPDYLRIKQEIWGQVEEEVRAHMEATGVQMGDD